MSNKIFINDIRLYAFHGCLAEESVIGGQYIVDVEIDTDYSKAEASDELSGTVDYCIVYEIVRQEMDVRSNLIEHAARRIANALKQRIPAIESVKVKLTKLSPPVNGNVGSVSVIAGT